MKLSNLFIDYFVDFLANIDRLFQVGQVDVEVGHQKLSEAEREQQFPALFHPVAVSNLECSEGQVPVAQGPVLHHRELLEAGCVS